MATPTRVNSYSTRELDFIERGFKQGLQITLSSAKAANYQRLRLYGLRKALRAEGHPSAFFAENITMVVQDNVLTITRVDNIQANVVSVQALTDEASLPPLPPTPQPQAPVVIEEKYIDPMQSALEKLGYFAHGDKDKK